jgi:hypothetical protein
MRTAILKRGIAASGVMLLLALALFWFVYRPWALTWGATDEEVARPMPGDSVVADPTFNATRAVTIDAPPEAVWPWIIQIGYLRAGFYSYDRLDNDGIPSAERILPEFQQLAAGDSIPLTSDGYAAVAALEPNRSMLLVTGEEGPWTWAWGLYPVSTDQTRLVTRLRFGTTRIRTRLVLDALSPTALPAPPASPRTSSDSGASARG